VKKRIFSAILLCLLTSGLCGGLAAGGTSADPVVSLSYINSDYIPAFYERADKRIETALRSVYNEAFKDLAEEAGARNAADAVGETSLGVLSGEAKFKSGDRISGAPGLLMTLNTGTASLITEGGSLTAASSGVAVTGGAKAVPGQTYLVNSYGAGFLITSDTATVTLNGDVTLYYSPSVDYNSMADALYSMGLFKGRTDGYALNSGATRAEGIVMFLRLIGEEDDALSFTGTHPFTDAGWADRYVAYAYSKGYTKGVSSTKFGTNDPLTAAHYVTFILRAIGYSEDTDYAWKTVLSDVVKLNVLSNAEVTALQRSFTRAHVVYLSYWSLFQTLKDRGDSVLTSLIASASVNEATAIRAVSTARAIRIS
jgi:hypothetical protein